MHKEDAYEPVPKEYQEAARLAVDAAMAVHRNLGPGLLESVYQSCMVYELRKRGAKVKTEVNLPVIYDGVHLDAAFRIDVLVNGCLIVELKAVDELTDLHLAQVLTYLKLSGHRLALLINFNARLLKQGIKRVII